MARIERSPTRAAVYVRSRMGDEAVKALFSDIWHFFYPRLYAFISRMAFREADVEDAVQETLLKVYRNLKEYRMSYAVSTWVYSIARNYCLDQVRASRSSIRLVSEYELEIESPYAKPEEVILARETTEKVKLFIETLSPEDQQIAFLRFFEEMPYGEMSLVLRVPVGTLKYRVHAIRKRFRERKEDFDA